MTPNCQEHDREMPGPSCLCLHRRNRSIIKIWPNMPGGVKRVEVQIRSRKIRKLILEARQTFDEGEGVGARLAAGEVHEQNLSSRPRVEGAKEASWLLTGCRQVNLSDL